MNKNVNNYNEKEIKNKLKNFKENQDYSVSPTEEPEIKTYSFFNNELKSWFRGDRIPVRVKKEAYDGKDYTYRGHFEEGKDYYYSHQTWEGNVPAEEDGWHPIWKSEGRFSNGDWSRRSMRFRPLQPNNEPRKIDGHSYTPIKGQWCCGTDEVSNRRAHLERWKKDRKEMEGQLDRAKRNNDSNDIARVKSIIATLDQKIKEHENWLSHYGHNEDIQQRGRMGRNETGKLITDKRDEHSAGCCVCGFREISLSDSYCTECGAFLCDEAKKPAKSDKSDLEKENRELKKQLAEVKNELVKVLEELKKLRNNSAGQNNTELDQQIDYNERLISNGQKVSETEIKEQVQKSQALLDKVNSNVVPTKDNSGSGSLPYVIGGAVLVSVAAIIGYYLWNSKRKNKIS